MSSSTRDDKLKTLLADAKAATAEDELQHAAASLREASHLDPADEGVKAAWRNLQQRERHGPFLALLRRFVETSDNEAGEKALRALHHQPLADHDATQAIHLVLQATGHSPLLDTLTGALLSRNAAARKALASRFPPHVVPLFAQLFARGAASFQAFTALALDAAVWPSAPVQRTAQRDLFRLCISQLIEAGAEHPERAMQAIATQLATNAAGVQDVLDADTFDTVLCALDLGHPQALRGQAMLAVSRMLEVTKEAGEQIFTSFITSRVGQHRNEELIPAFSAAAACFPLLPAAVARLFLTEGFLQQLLPVLEHNHSRRLEHAALELFSAACVDKACREAVAKYCVPWLQSVYGDWRGLATLVLAKVDATSDVASQLTGLALGTHDDQSEQGVEGLAYASLQPQAKDDIASNAALLKRLVDALKSNQKAVFGVLTVFTNLTTYKPVQSERQKKMAQLKAYANALKPAPADDPLEDDAQVTTRCRKVIDAGAIPALLACNKTSANISATTVTLTTAILLSLAKSQQHRATLAQQGAVKLLLQIISKQHAPAPPTAAHAVARLLISVNPAHVFSSGMPAASAVAPLAALLTPDEAAEEKDLLPVFEALLALTNLASMPDDSVRELIIRKAWATIEDLLLSSNVLVQRAAAELVCNLMAAPQGVAKFADGSKQARSRMHVLLALADVEDVATRRAAGGALAMLTEWDAAVAAVLEKERGVTNLLGLVEDGDEELRHRGVACLLNVVSAPGEVGKRGVAKVREEHGVDVLRDMLGKTTNAELLSLGVETLKRLI